MHARTVQTTTRPTPRASQSRYAVRVAAVLALVGIVPGASIEVLTRAVEILTGVDAWLRAVETAARNITTEPRELWDTNASELRALNLLASMERAERLARAPLPAWLWAGLVAVCVPGFVNAVEYPAAMLDPHDVAVWPSWALDHAKVGRAVIGRARAVVRVAVAGQTTVRTVTRH